MSIFALNFNSMEFKQNTKSKRIPSTVLSYYVPGLIVHCKEEEEKVL